MGGYGLDRHEVRMPTWGQILKEINDLGSQLSQNGAPPPISPYDIIRRKYLTDLVTKTGRPVILYATAWTTGRSVSPEMISIGNEDTHALMETVHGIAGPSLDLILHSPGGSPSAAEAMVHYLRTRFNDIRVIVPNMAMSAATMLACAADCVMMGKHSFLGPIDPQLIMQTALGQRAVPAQAIVAQFKRAMEECADPVKLRAWLPMLNQYGPDLLVTCQNASDLSEQLVTTWLETYMFRGEADANTRAASIASWLAGHDNFKNHGRPIARDALKARGLKIADLEQDQEIQDLVLSIFHATIHTFSGTPAVKIVENHLGKAYMKMANVMQAVQVGGIQHQFELLPMGPGMPQPLPMPSEPQPG